MNRKENPKKTASEGGAKKKASKPPEPGITPTGAEARPDRKDAKRGAEIKTEREALNLNLTPDEHAGLISMLPSGWLVQGKINQAVWDSLSDGEKQARTELLMRDHAKAEQLWRELVGRTNANIQKFTYDRDTLEEFRVAYATANTGSEKLEAIIQCLNFITGRLFADYKLPKDSLDADYLRFMSNAYLMKWHACAADERYTEPLLKDLAMRMDGTLLAFFDTQLTNAEAEKGSALTATQRKALEDSLLKSLDDYIDAEFLCEHGEIIDEVVEEYRRPGRPPKFDVKQATDRYLDLWSTRHVGEKYASDNIDRELVKQVMHEMNITASHWTVYRAIQNEIAYRMGEEVYPLKITLTLYEKQMAAVSMLAHGNGHDPTRLSPKETVRAALGLKPHRRQK